MEWGRSLLCWREKQYCRGRKARVPSRSLHAASAAGEEGSRGAPQAPWAGVGRAETWILRMKSGQETEAANADCGAGVVKRWACRAKCLPSTTFSNMIQTQFLKKCEPWQWELLSHISDTLWRWILWLHALFCFPDPLSFIYSTRVYGASIPFQAQFWERRWDSGEDEAALALVDTMC